MTKRLAIVASHPIQYLSPLYRELAKIVDLKVFFAHQPSPQQQAEAGFGTEFDWDVDLLGGYDHAFLRNIAARPDASRFDGCDTPAIGGALKAGCFDAVLVNGWYLKTFLQAIWAAKLLRMRVMVRGDSQLGSPRGVLKRFAKQALYPPALRMFDIAFYVGERSREYYRAYGVAGNRLVFAPHCVDNDWFAERARGDAGPNLRKRLGISANTPVVLFAGKLVPFKRPLDVVDATAHLREQGLSAEVIIAGSGELQAPLHRRAHELQVPLHCLGFQNQTQMPAAYAAANALALPSTGRETWGLVCNEALACGVPVVVSDAVGCAPDFAGDGKSGAMFPFGQTPVLAEKLQRLLTCPPTSEEIGEKISRYSVRTAADAIAGAI